MVVRRLIGCCLAAMVLFTPALAAEAGNVTVFYLVRHAERPAGEDPSLSPEGVRRAVELQNYLRDQPLAAIYATRFKRTRETAAPIAEESNIVLAQYPQAEKPLAIWADELVAGHRGQHVLIVGHAGRADQIYLGFRGSVLRNGFVPVLRLPFDDQRDNEILYVNLKGRGIRDLVKVEDGFLIVAGPVSNAPMSYLLYHWDGADTLPGVRAADEAPRGTTTLLGRIPTPAGAKAEGIALMAESADHYEVLIVYDGIEGGGMQILRAPRSSSNL